MTNLLDKEVLTLEDIYTGYLMGNLFQSAAANIIVQEAMTSGFEVSLSSVGIIQADWSYRNHIVDFAGDVTLHGEWTQNGEVVQGEMTVSVQSLLAHAQGEFKQLQALKTMMEELQA